MASPIAMYFAGIGTVVIAMSVGFGGALMLVDTKPQPSAHTTIETKVGAKPISEPEPKGTLPHDEAAYLSALPATANAMETTQGLGAQAQETKAKNRRTAGPVTEETKTLDVGDRKSPRVDAAVTVPPPFGEKIVKPKIPNIRRSHTATTRKRVPPRIDEDESTSGYGDESRSHPPELFRFLFD